MEKIGDGIYRHEGNIVELKHGKRGHVCVLCFFNNRCPLSCATNFGHEAYFIKYEEPKVEKIKLSELSFKCAVLTPERSEILQRAIFNSVLCEPDACNHPRAALIVVKNGVFSYFVSENIELFEKKDVPQVTLQQALDLIATVEKPEPVFDIKFGDDMLFRLDSNFSWKGGRFGTIKEDYFIDIQLGKYAQIIKLDQEYFNTTISPSGWWEAKDGKPVWVTK